MSESKMTPAEVLEILSHHARFCRTHLGDDCTHAKEWDAMAAVVAAMVAENARLRELLRDCRDYLSCIPESAAGGDDDAVRLAKRAESALTGAGHE